MEARPDARSKSAPYVPIPGSKHPTPRITVPRPIDTSEVPASPSARARPRRPRIDENKVKEMYAQQLKQARVHVRRRNCPRARDKMRMILMQRAYARRKHGGMYRSQA